MENSGAVTQPGLYKSLDPQSLERMISTYSEEVSRSRERGQLFCKHREEYQQLSKKLETLCDKTSHQVMVPFTKKAFMPGRLVHTNEILVLLGDNWFAERSAKQAREICHRRIDKCDETLKGIEKEIGLYESWIRESKQLSGGGGEIEIREPYDEDELKKWREEHKKKNKHYRQKQKENKEVNEEDEELFRRLDELELQEELEEHLEKNRQEDSSSSSDESDDDENETNQTSQDGNAGDSSNPLRLDAVDAMIDNDLLFDQNTSKKSNNVERKVSFGKVREHVIASRHNPEPVVSKNVIVFEHTNVEVENDEKSEEILSTPKSPGDLYLMFESHLTSSPKSILKPRPSPSSEDENSEEDDFFSSEIEPRYSEPCYSEPAISDQVFEREVEPVFNPPDVKQQSGGKRQSLFKQSRFKK